MNEHDVNYGDEVLVPWGLQGDVTGTVHEVYGPPGRRFIVVLLTPEVSGPVVEGPTTVSVPMNDVSKHGNVA